MPIYPDAPQSVLDPATPVAYAIDPVGAGGPAARIVANSLRVWVDATLSDGGLRRRLEFAPTTNFDQSTIGAVAPLDNFPGANWWQPLGTPSAGPQFAPFLTDRYSRSAEVRFNRYRPPSPQAFGPPGTLAAYPDGLRIIIVGTLRHNFDPDYPDSDDRVMVSYSTGRTLDIGLKIARFEPLVDVDESNPQFVLVPEQTGGPVTVHDEVNVHNLGR